MTATEDPWVDEVPAWHKRPQGDPIPRHMTLPPGEDLVPMFCEWDRAGRIPEGCVLCKFQATFGSRPSYKKVYGKVPDGRSRIVAVIEQEYRTYCVLLPVVDGEKDR